MNKAYLKAGKERATERRHPWIFSGAIQSYQHKPCEGELLQVLTAANEVVGTGQYHSDSIAVRMLTFTDEPVDTSFWYRRIATAYQVRCALGLVNSAETTLYRLVCGEGDGLPGLIIDVYESTAVMQAHTLGMHLNREVLADALCQVYGEALRHVYYKAEAGLRQLVQPAETDYFILGGEQANPVAKENGLSFSIDMIRGQKTGFFIDQRTNRQLLSEYVRGKKVLNMFCYTGGFSLYALKGGSALVHSVDSSARAVRLTEENVARNYPGQVNHQAFAMDAFDFLDAAKESYEVMVLDPPAFAKHRTALKNALKGYRKLNAKGLEHIAPGGLLFTFSCSQVVSKDDFRTAVFSAAALSGRNVRILHQLTQAPDHPISIYHPEGEYLKGLVLYVE